MARDMHFRRALTDNRNTVSRASPRRIGLVIAFALVAGTTAASAPATAAPEDHPALGPPVVQRTFTDTSKEGYTLRASVRIYRTAHVNALPVLPYDQRSSLTCPVDENADAAIPVAFTLTNTTARANIGLG